MAKHREKMHLLFEQLYIYDALFICEAGDSTVIILREDELESSFYLEAERSFRVAPNIKALP